MLLLSVGCQLILQLYMIICMHSWSGAVSRFCSSNADLVMQLNCIESDSHSAINTIYMLDTINAMVNLKQFYPYIWFQKLTGQVQLIYNDCTRLQITCASNNNKRNLGFSQSAENFESVCVMLQEIMGYLNTIKRYPARIFMKFEIDEFKGSFEISFCVCSIRIFTKFWVIPIMNHQHCS